MSATFDQRLARLSSILPSSVIQQATIAIMQMKANAAQLSTRYTPLRQIKNVYPRMTDEQLAVMAFYILCKSGTVDSVSETGEVEQLRLQMAMDQASEVFEALNGLLTQNTSNELQIAKSIKA